MEIIRVRLRLYASIYPDPNIGPFHVIFKSARREDERHEGSRGLLLCGKITPLYIELPSPVMPPKRLLRSL